MVIGIDAGGKKDDFAVIKFKNGGEIHTGDPVKLEGGKLRGVNNEDQFRKLYNDVAIIHEAAIDEPAYGVFAGYVPPKDMVFLETPAQHVARIENSYFGKPQENPEVSKYSVGYYFDENKI